MTDQIEGELEDNVMMTDKTTIHLNDIKNYGTSTSAENSSLICNIKKTNPINLKCGVNNCCCLNLESTIKRCVTITITIFTMKYIFSNNFFYL